ncbi:Uu.00g067600.m01.CDS01 [Anthostomella pinea]|uniref:Uu.00g067600.m01.CDS01 n=1 Tax=Anthostomella pinea TaxID=933095 RepID=A0AAI8YNF6_9PEZI|nr:Uu.00g067600.m01.CDS01 [Anthostomella pinea]
MPKSSGSAYTNTPAAGSAPPGYTPARRTPTDSSYYDMDGIPWKEGDPNSQAWIYAREVRAQQAKAPLQRTARAKYPSPFKNAEPLPLTTPGKPDPTGNKPTEWLHHPMIPGKTTTYRASAKSKAKPGGIRTFYTEGDNSKYDVGFHDPRVWTPSKSAGFSLATYVPAAPPKPKT